MKLTGTVNRQTKHAINKAFRYLNAFTSYERATLDNVLKALMGGSALLNPPKGKPILKSTSTQVEVSPRIFAFLKRKDVIEMDGRVKLGRKSYSRYIIKDMKEAEYYHDVYMARQALYDNREADYWKYLNLCREKYPDRVRKE